MKQIKSSSKSRLSSYSDDKGLNEYSQENRCTRDLNNENVKKSLSRLQIRKEIIAELLKSCTVDEKFNHTLDRIIDMEETFVLQQINVP